MRFSDKGAAYSLELLKAAALPAPRGEWHFDGMQLAGTQLRSLLHCN
jgi:hypothetical protein